MRQLWWCRLSGRCSGAPIARRRARYEGRLIDETRYGIRVEVPLAYEEVVERTTQALKSEGFGVLTTIDVKQTLD